MDEYLDKLIATCESNMIITNEASLSNEEIDTKYISTLKELYTKCISEAKKILNKPEHKKAKVGFKITPFKYENNKSIIIDLIHWDIHKIYNEDELKKSDLPEYLALYKDIINSCNKIIQEYFNHKPLLNKLTGNRKYIIHYTKEVGGWDTGDIKLAIPVKLLIK